MKIGKWAGLLLAAAAPLTGCGNFWQAPSSGGGGTGTNPPGCTSNCGGGNPTSLKNFYVLNQATSQIAAYTIASSKFTAISGSPYTLSSKPYSIAVAPSGTFLYVGTVGGIYLYTVNSTTGALTLGNGGTAISKDFATTMQVDPSSSWLVEAGPNLAEVLALPIDSSSGLLGAGGEQTASVPAATVNQLVVSPDNGHVFIADGTSGTVAMGFQSTQTNPFEASLAVKIPVKNSGGSALSVAVDPDNRVFYIGETQATTGTNSGGVRVFNFASLSSTLTESTGSPYPSGGLSPAAILPASGGKYTYVANGAGATTKGNVAAFAIQVSESAYTLTAGATVAAGINPAGLAEDGSDTYVLLVDSGGTPDLAAFTINSATGALTSAVTASTGTDPVQAVAIAAAP